MLELAYPELGQSLGGYACISTGECKLSLAIRRNIDHYKTGVKLSW